MAKQEVKVKIEFTPGYEKRYTRAVMEAYQKKANREGRTMGGVFFPQNGSRGNQ